MVERQQAFSEEQLTQLLLRLAAAPDLSLFRDKWERLEHFRKSELQNMQMSTQLLRQLEAALARGLLLLVPLFSLDLPKRALYCITCLQQLLQSAQMQLLQQLEFSDVDDSVKTPDTQHFVANLFALRLELFDNPGEHA
jgi:hypothetical protein